jgi:hypothetical protein
MRIPQGISDKSFKACQEIKEGSDHSGTQEAT